MRKLKEVMRLRFELDLGYQLVRTILPRNSLRWPSLHLSSARLKQPFTEMEIASVQTTCKHPSETR